MFSFTAKTAESIEFAVNTFSGQPLKNLLAYLRVLGGHITPNPCENIETIFAVTTYGQMKIAGTVYTVKALGVEKNLCTSWIRLESHLTGQILEVGERSKFSDLSYRVDNFEIAE